MPLWLGMVPGEKNTQALHMNLLNDIVVKQKTHLSTGILGAWPSSRPGSLGVPHPRTRDRQGPSTCFRPFPSLGGPISPFNW